MPIAMSRPRPAISCIPQTPAQWAVEVAAFLGLLIPIVFLVVRWPQIPAVIPTHFGAGGSPDSWGAKTSLIALPIISGCIYLLFTVMSAFPHILNYPVEVTEMNAQHLYRIAVDTLRWVKCEFIWLFGYLSVMIVQVALKRAESLGVWLLPVVMVILFGTTIISIVRMVRAAKA